MPEYIHQLGRMFHFDEGDLKPSTFEPVTRYVLALLGGAWLDYIRHEVPAFLQ